MASENQRGIVSGIVSDNEILGMEKLRVMVIGDVE